MSQHIQVFTNGDPLLLPYLAHYLQSRSCNILEDDGKFYLRSSYLENASSLAISSKTIPHFAGLMAVLSLFEPEFDTLSPSMKIEKCIEGLLYILNGILIFKYKAGSLVRVMHNPLSVQESGIDYNVDASGHKVYTATRSISTRLVLTAGNTYFRNADKQKPTTKKLWNMARTQGSVARVFYHYTKSEDLVELRKVIEEIVADTSVITGRNTGKIKFDDWNNQKWTEPEIKQHKMKECWIWLHNRYLSNDQALHSESFSNIRQATTLKTLGSTMSLQEARDIVHTLLLKWVKSKP